MSSLFDFAKKCYSHSFKFSSKLKKDCLCLKILCDNSLIIENLCNFISLEKTRNIKSTFADNLTTFYFLEDSGDHHYLDCLLKNSQIIKIHGGTQEQHMYANFLTDGNLKLYRINSGKLQYVIQDNITNSYILIGDKETLKLDLLRIVREVYYRYSLKLGKVAFHSAAIAKSNNESLLITGPKGAGKTTLMCNLLYKSNLSFLDNERVLLGVENNSVIASSLSSTVNIALGTLKNYPTLNYNKNSISLDKKIKFSRFEFINKFNCNSITTSSVKKILFPNIQDNYSNTSITKCNLEKKIELISTNIEELNTDEHPDWLGIANITSYSYTKNSTCILNAMLSIDSYIVNYGFSLLDVKSIKSLL